jgi:hypothetical protein
MLLYLCGIEAMADLPNPAAVAPNNLDGAAEEPQEPVAPPDPGRYELMAMDSMGFMSPFVFGENGVIEDAFDVFEEEDEMKERASVVIRRLETLKETSKQRLWVVNAFILVIAVAIFFLFLLK